MTAYLSRRSTVGTGSAPVYTDSPPAFDDLEPIESGQYGRPAFYRARSNTTVSGLIAAPETRASFKLAGKRLTTPLISVEAVKAHLRLLAAFNQLRKDVMNHKQPELEAAGITDEDRWSIFLVKAHTRFEAWLNSRTCEPECCKHELLANTCKLGEYLAESSQMIFLCQVTMSLHCHIYLPA